LSTFSLGYIWWRIFKLNPLKHDSLNLLGFLGLYLVESGISIGWAYLIFKVFNKCDFTIKDYMEGFKKYLFKGTFISLFTGMIVFLGAFNIHFYVTLTKQLYLYNVLAAAFIFWILFFWVSAFLYQWPILFFQDPPIWKIFYKSVLLVLSNSLVSLSAAVFFLVFFTFFTVTIIPWFFIGYVFFFSIQCVMLEKQLLRYRITYQSKPVDMVLRALESERKRSWRELLRPWEYR
jgi:hypothetical protein